MAVIIAFMISLGVITSSDQATPDLIDTYTQIYNSDTDVM